MSAARPYEPSRVRKACDSALADVLDGLDRRSYPETLYSLLRTVLLPEAPALRATALLTAAAAAANGVPEAGAEILAAQEMFLRGWFLQASLAVAKEDYELAGGPAAKISAGYSPALVLLAADTLFTLPFEVLARDEGKRAAGAVSRFAAAFGPAGLLGRLDRAGESIEAFLDVDPVEALAGAALDTLPADYGFTVLTRYCYLREAWDWFGPCQPLSCRMAGLADRRKCLSQAEDTPPGNIYAALYSFLGE